MAAEMWTETGSETETESESESESGEEGDTQRPLELAVRVDKGMHLVEEAWPLLLAEGLLRERESATPPPPGSDSPLRPETGSGNPLQHVSDL